jgi:Kef-type K+ transport system membrane component KefB
MTIAEFLVSLIAIFAAAKLCGEVAERLGQPAVLGEMVGGIIIGVSGFQLVDPHNQLIHLLAELGVILLLFLIGLETDLGKLLSVGPSAVVVALVGVALPFLGGWFVGRALGYPSMVSIFLGAALTATSVGITARVLADLGHLKDRESQVILGAAVFDDILGLVILTLIASLTKGESVTLLGVGRLLLIAFGFVILAVVLGNFLAPYLMKIVARLRVAKAVFFASIVFALALAWAAEAVGSALIIGAFAAGLVLARTDQGHQIEHEVHDAAQIFIPIFFVSVGAAVDLRTLNPFSSGAKSYVLVGLLLAFVGIVGKLLAGYAAIGKGLRRTVIGVGMIPRGEVGLIFAKLGLSSGLLTAGLYSSVAAMVMLTTFIAPAALRMLLSKEKAEEHGLVAELVTDAMQDHPPAAGGSC